MKTKTSRVHNIRMDSRETGWGCMYWVVMAQNRDQQWRALVNTVMNHGVP
jgi:hypothetical protein